MDVIYSVSMAGGATRKFIQNSFVLANWKKEDKCLYHNIFIVFYLLRNDSKPRLYSVLDFIIIHRIIFITKRHKKFYSFIHNFLSELSWNFWFSLLSSHSQLLRIKYIDLIKGKNRLIGYATTTERELFMNTIAYEFCQLPNFEWKTFRLASGKVYFSTIFDSESSDSVKLSVMTCFRGMTLCKLIKTIHWFLRRREMRANDRPGQEFSEHWSSNKANGRRKRNGWGRKCCTISACRRRHHT